MAEEGANATSVTETQQFVLEKSGSGVVQNRSVRVDVVCKGKGRDSEDGEGLRGVVTSAPIANNEILYRIPSHSIFNTSTCLAVLKNLLAEDSFSSLLSCPGWTPISICLLAVRHWSPRDLPASLSPLAPVKVWISSVPAAEQLDSVCLWTEEEASQFLHGSHYLYLLNMQRRRARQEVGYVKAFVDENVDYSDMLPDGDVRFSMDEYLHVFALLQSRGFEEGMEEIEETEEEEAAVERPMAMFPWADMLNHSPGCGYWKYEKSTDDVCFLNGVQCEGDDQDTCSHFSLRDGDECLIDYAVYRKPEDRTGFHFLEHCGFVPDRSPYEGSPLHLYISAPNLPSDVDEDSPAMPDFEGRERMRQLYMAGVVTAVDLTDPADTIEGGSKVTGVALEGKGEARPVPVETLVGGSSFVVKADVMLWPNQSPFGLFSIFDCLVCPLSELQERIALVKEGAKGGAAGREHLTATQEFCKTMLSEEVASATATAERLEGILRTDSSSSFRARLVISALRLHTSTLNSIISEDDCPTFSPSSPSELYCCLFTSLERGDESAFERTLRNSSTPITALSPAWFEQGEGLTLIEAVLSTGVESLVFVVVKIAQKDRRVQKHIAYQIKRGGGSDQLCTRHGMHEKLAAVLSSAVEGKREIE
uniref:SET domain-containing protein n=1 Tax=Palpitomonas bilix TaxID=652834 RepID=A0A7S3GER6_9EUKA|mmetsp:Transcript_46451/g.119874  ORF Transcript_46451/g.119874 Transcript_46451/m.119874 type:complete len:648 (+) Transcript_46451:137-2080(+)